MKKKITTKSYSRYEVRDCDTNYLYHRTANYELAQAYCNRINNYLTKTYIVKIDINECVEVIENGN